MTHRKMKKGLSICLGIVELAAAVRFLLAHSAGVTDWQLGFGLLFFFLGVGALIRTA